MQILKDDSAQFEQVAEPELDTSISSVNMSMRKEKSAQYLSLSKSKSKKTAQLFKTIDIRVGGISFYAPDTHGFDKNSSKGELDL